MLQKVENRSARLDESDSIQKRKRLETKYEKCARLLRGSFNVTYAVLLLRAHKYQPPGGVHIFLIAYSSSTKFYTNCCRGLIAHIFHLRTFSRLRTLPFSDAEARGMSARFRTV